MTSDRYFNAKCDRANLIVIENKYEKGRETEKNRETNYIQKIKRKIMVVFPSQQTARQSLL